MVIPAMDHINQVLSMYSHNKSFLPSICSDVSLAQETLNCYYSGTDQSKVYHIAMSKYFINFIFQPSANVDYSSSPQAQVILLQNGSLGRGVDSHH